MIEVLRAYEWIQSTLSADATLAALVGSRIYSEQAPQERVMPFVVFNLQGGTDLRAVGTVRVYNNSLYQVKGVTQGRDYATGKSIADRIDVLLHGAAGNTSDGSILGCVREQPLVFAENDGGVEYRHVGGLYRLYVQET